MQNLEEICLLAVDDDTEFLDVLGSFLKLAFPNARVQTTSNGLEVLNIAIEEGPDVILLDIVMPDVNGLEICQKLKAHEYLSEIPVVILTGMDTNPEYRIKALEVEADGFLSKTLDQNELIAQIKTMVKIRQSNRRERLEKEQLKSEVKKASSELEKKFSEIKQLADQWDKTFNSLSDALFILDKDMRIVRWNAEASRVFSTENESMVGKQCYKVVHGRSTPHPNCPLQKTAKTLKRASADLKIGDDWFQVVVDPILDDHNQHSGYLHVFSNITARKEMEFALNEKTTSLEQAIQMAGFGQWYWDIRTGDMTWTEKVYQIFQQDPDNFTPSVPSVGKLILPDSKHQNIHSDLIQAATKSHDQETRERCFRRPDNSLGWYLTQFRGVYDHEDRLVAIKGTLLDITERKIREHESELNSVRNSSLLDLQKAAERLEEPRFVKQAMEKLEKLTDSTISFCNIIDDNEEMPDHDEEIWMDAYKAKAPVIFNDGSQIPNRHNLFVKKNNLLRLISVPIVEDGQVVMLLAFGNKEIDYTSHDVETVQIISNEVWRIIDRKRRIVKKEAVETKLLEQAKEMERRNKELKQFNNLMVDRELRMIELKKEINQLCQDIGIEKRYSDITLPEPSQQA